MKRPLNKGRQACLSGMQARQRSTLWGSLERFHVMHLRLVGFLHQFKTPLHVIQSQAELLLDDPALTPNLRRSIELMHQNAGRLAIQTQNLMGAARGPQNGFEIAPIEPQLEHICRETETDRRKRHIALDKETAGLSPIRLGPDTLQAALPNLQNNA